MTKQNGIQDRGVWITWYDLPDQGHDAYLAWLHQTYIPGLLTRRGYLWAAHYASVQKSNTATNHKLTHTNDSSLPTGDRYILLVGAEHAHVFGDPVPSALNAKLSESDRRMLATRKGERVNVFTEAARVEGPATPSYPSGMALTPCIQLGSFNCDWREEEEMLAWYAQWRMPAMTVTPGIVRTRKLASVAGWAKHAIIYEWTSLELRNQYFPIHEDQNPEMKAWSSKMVPKLIHAPGSSNVACRIWPPVT